jgi:hypothetical protein
MGQCDQILKHGVFDTVIKESSKTVAENLYWWLKETDTGTIQDTQKSGLALGLPFKGIPLEIKLSHSDEEIEKWKKAVDTGGTRQFTQHEAEKIVVQTASPVIVKAWVDCIKKTAFGLIHYLGSDGDTLTVFFRWSPNSVDDLPPTVLGFVVVGATAVNPPTVGAQVPYGGLVIVLKRTLLTSGPELYPPVTVVLNTTKGAAEEWAAAIARPAVKPETPLVDVKVFSQLGPHAPHPEATVTVDQGYKVIAGGARVNWQGGSGNLLTASYPDGSRKWVAKAKDHIHPSSATIEVWAVALRDPQDQWEVEIFRKDSTPTQHPDVQVTVDQGFVMTGGGAQAHWHAEGSLLTASCPVGRDTWRAQSKDHLRPDAVTLTAYAIGIRPRNGAFNVLSTVTEATSAVASHPWVTAGMENGWKLVGGGARVEWQGAGNLLTASYPHEPTGWAAASKDHLETSPARITAYAIGVRPPKTVSQIDFPRFVHTTPNEEGWRWCNKCQGLILTGTDRGVPPPCAAGGRHDHTGSGRYLLIYNAPMPHGQPNWRRCRKCASLVFAGSTGPGACSAGGTHDHTGSHNYHLAADVPGGQRKWRWCNKCQGLAFGGGRLGPGSCAAGGVHNHAGSGDYALVYFAG